MSLDTDAGVKRVLSYNIDGAPCAFGNTPISSTGSIDAVA